MVGGGGGVKKDYKWLFFVGETFGVKFGCMTLNDWGAEMGGDNEFSHGQCRGIF